MKRVLFLLGILSLTTITPARAETSREVSPTGKYIFDCYHVNWAWGYILSGFYIDNKGDIFKYERLLDPWLPKEARLEESELAAKYKNKQHVGSLPLGILKNAIQQISSASKGEISHKHRAYDAGASACTAYIYDNKMKRYSPVELGTMGVADWEVKNSSPEAERLLGWLQTVEKEYLKPRNTPEERSR